MGNILCDGSPVESDPRRHLKGRQWETSMLNAPCNNCKGCCLATFFPCCFAYHLRVLALEGRMENYSCCQGYICGNCTSKCIPGQDSCPGFCLCLEVTCFENLAISSTRFYVQEQRQIITDPCDNRIIRFNNCVQLLACLCHILAIFFREARQLAHLLDLFADLVYCIVQACMQAQTHHELTLHPTAVDYGPSAVTSQPVSDKAPLIPNQAPPSYQ
eukprot:m.254377 g.254377  ORF g.254377 m.254377 type:complete len:216 (+) comp17991_c0_seq1:178-825(+)